MDKKEEEKTTAEKEEVMTTCPCCGKPITFSNDALNGFCIECTRKGLVD